MDIYKSGYQHQLLAIFSGTMLSIIAYESAKEILVNGSLSSPLYAITILLIATFTAITLIHARSMIGHAEVQQNIAAVAFESQNGMTITDAQSNILMVNRAFTECTGYSAEEVIGKKPHVLRSGRHDAHFYAAMWQSLKHHNKWEGEIWNRRKSGEIYPEYLSITAVKSRRGVVTNYVASFTDITKRKKSEDEIQKLVFYDSLTGLPNRHLLLNRLKKQMSISARNHQEGSLLLIDINNLKTLNDSLGHDMGDLLLQEVAKRLKSCVREGDTVARIGGDEFIVMLEDLGGYVLEAAEQTKVVSHKIFASLKQPFTLASHEYHCSISVGATLFPGKECSIPSLLKEADIALHQAKKAGRNVLCFFDSPMQEAINTRTLLERELHLALTHQQFELYYQVQVDDAHRPIGAEALIRWVHPERGIIAPTQFIPMAEEIGLIVPIGRWVIDTACAQLAAWQNDPKTRHLILAINVSARQFSHAGFDSQVQAALSQYAVNPNLLKLELTENLLLENIEDTISIMSKLKNIGVQFSLDDFGTGYSSLQYLKRLPLDQIKIDQSFIRDITKSSSDKAIVRTIIAMAKSLEMNVIAEGVETEEQKQLLLNKGCTHYQGFLFSQPVPISQFEAYLSNAGI